MLVSCTHSHTRTTAATTTKWKTESEGLLTSGVLTVVIDCRYTALCQAAVPQLAIKEALSVAKKRIETPWLNVAYRSYEKGL